MALMHPRRPDIDCFPLRLLLSRRHNDKLVRTVVKISINVRYYGIMKLKRARSRTEALYTRTTIFMKRTLFKETICKRTFHLSLRWSNPRYLHMYWKIDYQRNKERRNKETQREYFLDDYLVNMVRNQGSKRLNDFRFYIYHKEKKRGYQFIHTLLESSKSIITVVYVRRCVLGC